MSSRSSSSLICRRSQTSSTRQPPGPRAPGVDQDARQRHQPREALRPDRRLAAGGAASAAADSPRRAVRDRAARRPRRSAPPPRGRAPRRHRRRASPWRSASSATRRWTPRSSSGGATRRAFSPRPSTQEMSSAGSSSRCGTRASPLLPSSLAAGRADLAVAPEVALDLPGDPLGDENLRNARAPRPTASRRGSHMRAGRSPPAAGSRARPSSRMTTLPRIRDRRNTRIALRSCA